MNNNNKNFRKVLTIGGATRDIYLHYHGADYIKIVKSSGELRYMLFESGAKVEVEKVLYYTGGGSTNSVVSFKRLGFETSCFCRIGDDMAGRDVLRDLEQEGIETKNIIICKDSETGTSFVINSLRKERTIFAYRGANSFLKDKDIPFEAIKNSNQLYITSLSNESSHILGSVCEYAKKHNVSVAINPGVSQLSKGVQDLKSSLKNIDVLILNLSEAKTFMAALIEKDRTYKKLFVKDKAVEKELNNESSANLLEVPVLYENVYFCIPSFFKEVLKMGPHIVVVTNGGNGVYVATQNEVLFHSSLKTEIIDTLGAGDAFGSCFVASLGRGFSIAEALRNGVINSTSVINHIGAKPGLLSYDVLEKEANKLGLSLVQRYLL